MPDSLGILILLFFANLPSSASFHAFDCSNAEHNHAKAFDLNHVQSCPTQSQLPPPNTHPIQVVQTRLFNSIHVRQCHIQLEKRVTICNIVTRVQWGEPVDGRQTVMHYLNKSSCDEVHATGKLTLYDVPLTEIKPNATVDHWIPLRGEMYSNGHCYPQEFAFKGKTYEHATLRANAFIRLQDFEAKVDTTTDEIIFPSGLSCTFSDGFCQDALEGLLSWDPSPFNDCRDLHYDVLYDGPANSTTSATNVTYVTLVSATHLMAHVILNSTTQICNTRVWPTQLPRIFILDRRQHAYSPFKDSYVVL